jgi:hypothetical protein
MSKKVTKMPEFPAPAPREGVMRSQYSAANANIPMENKIEPRDEGKDFSGQVKSHIIARHSSDDNPKTIKTDRSGDALRTALPPTQKSHRGGDRGTSPATKRGY